MPTSVRFAAQEDLGAVEDIENDADRLLVERFRPETWAPAPPGSWRAAQPGFLLVAAEAPGGDAIGFAHVLARDGMHLEQLAVRVSSGRRGHGRALVVAALAEAEARGADRVTLRTYADVPWNAPFYASLGFVESEPDTDFLRGLVAVEAGLRLDRYGRRVQLTRPIGVRSPR